jgi:16S rRNA (guanine527-N7)-methyltransferase
MPEFEFIKKYFDLLVEEANTQNLLGRVEWDDFLNHHVLDAREFSKLFVGTSELFVDLGAGGGVVGILCALLLPESRWILVESEINKAQFCRRAVDLLQLGLRVRVIHSRFEKAPFKERFVCVSKAVGNLDYHHRILNSCSTWNSLWLFKGRNFSQELVSAKVIDKNIWKIFAERKYTSGETGRVIIGVCRQK